MPLDQITDADGIGKSNAAAIDAVPAHGAGDDRLADYQLTRVPRTGGLSSAASTPRDAALSKVTLHSKVPIRIRAGTEIRVRASLLCLWKITQPASQVLRKNAPDSVEEMLTRAWSFYVIHCFSW